MCDHDQPNRRANGRYGSALEDGHAHSEDHRRWSRRDFLSGIGAVGAGTLLLGASPVQAYGTSSLLSRLNMLDTNRILVLIQLKGGNDGLNTIIPYNDDAYYNARPNIAIPKTEAQVLDLDGNLGMHPSMTALQSYFGEGQMAIIHNVGYAEQTLSHFRSTDIWQTASEADSIAGSGWVGRYLDAANPGFIQNPPDRPLGVLIGGRTMPVFRGVTGDMGMQLSSGRFLEALTDGNIYNTNDVPATAYGEEMAFVRAISNNSFRYADAVVAAFAAADNDITYPGGQGRISTNLAIAARLIKGQLGARIYHVSLQGFDTHANQPGNHDELLLTLSQSIDAFLQDIAIDSAGSEILTMTYSEFGRRIAENGSNGTDHGAAAPLFLFGSGLSGGLYGSAPNLANIDGANIPYDIDFRSVYGSVLQDWFGFNRPDVESALLNFSYDGLGFVADPATVALEESGNRSIPGAYVLDQNHPNPFRHRTTIGYSLQSADHVRLDVYDLRGRRVRTLVDKLVAAGEHTAELDAGRLPSGTYIYRLSTAQGGVQSRKLALVK